MNSDVAIAYATFPDAETAERICRTLVTERLVACANVFSPHQSIYVWNDQLETPREVGAILKFARSLSDTLAQRFLELHPYDTPALVYLEVAGGAPEFLAWVAGK